RIRSLVSGEGEYAFVDGPECYLTLRPLSLRVANVHANAGGVGGAVIGLVRLDGHRETLDLRRDAELGVTDADHRPAGIVKWPWWRPAAAREENRDEDVRRERFRNRELERPPAGDDADAWFV